MGKQDNIEEKAVKLINSFMVEMDKCQDDTEYMDLIAASLVFKNLIINHFKDVLRKDLASETEIEAIVQAMINVSDDISKTVATVNIEKKHRQILN